MINKKLSNTPAKRSLFITSGPYISNVKKIIIIGGGISGLCSAYYLVKEGHEVTVVDQGEYEIRRFIHQRRLFDAKPLYRHWPSPV